MSASNERIAELEWANYAAMVSTVQATPGLDQVMRKDLILTSSSMFPTVDANHACLIRATSESVDGLIEEVIEYYSSRHLPTTVFISPACRPADLAARLSRLGFKRQQTDEAWVIYDHLLASKFPTIDPTITVENITIDDVHVFAQTFIAAFSLPREFVPHLAALMGPSVGLPGVYHYIARLGDEPLGVCSLLCHEGYGVVGSVGVLPRRRGSRAAARLLVTAGAEARRQGVDTVIGQTASGARFERFLLMAGLKTAFVRTGYTLHEYPG